MTSRRKVLQAAGTAFAASLAGCFGVGSGDAPAEISVINNRQETHVVPVTLSELDGTQLLDLNLEVRPSTTTDREDSFVPTTSRAEMGGWAGVPISCRSSRWKFPDDESFCRLYRRRRWPDVGSQITLGRCNHYSRYRLLVRIDREVAAREG